MKNKTLKRLLSMALPAAAVCLMMAVSASTARDTHTAAGTSIKGEAAAGTAPSTEVMPPAQVMLPTEVMPPTEAGLPNTTATTTSPSAASTPSAETARTDEGAQSPVERVEALMADFHKESTPGAAILVMRDNEVIYSRGFGMANLEYGIPFTEDTPNNIGSTAKQFTALAIAMLEEQGKLSVEDDIRTYIPELPAFEDTVRIRHLISHTSGYREFLNTLAMGGWKIGDHIAREEVITILQGQAELQNKPGEAYNYNN